MLALASKNSRPEDFNRPGHIFPLRCREGGVLKRAGHTEASVDLAVLAGLEPVAILCEIVDSLMFSQLSLICGCYFQSIAAF